ncbi:hypothetical protein CSUB_C0125 [Candidatus Caldarchaeum subterraneum]|uniref:Uncharacterized protein n=1 Tax=Caldiarchaeum subterraneum TaxID=311458 RepID=E6N3P1_CALS0|nr:hypothetical protein HGMM_F37B02C30 [Candidatus Caldarchaeum subterraneum]BAJ49040.1 hypothetical protein HGMM_F11E05C19 [Candidatus Caldarchaeum subterraneum]BAJ49070.1 hypothetical protein HGMM_F32H09C09 [Candidatus Caldarchaeum subterraneum]BAJ49988.1 hypothetical protein CSUB_C0125 [Candidatus Caldarchaeum subterraneum]
MTRFYADIHRKKDDSGYRITYTTDGKTFKHTDSPTEMPVGPGDEVFVDVIPVVHTDGFVELLRRGAEVYYLRRLTLIKKMRDKLGITSKSARADVKTLMAIEEKWFKKVDETYLIMRKKASTFRSLQKTLEQYKNRLEAASGDEREDLLDMVKITEKKLHRQAKRIVEEAERRYPAYSILVDELGISGENHILTQEALAEIMMYVDPRWGLRKTLNFFGLFKNTNKKKKKKYNGHARKALERLTITVYKIKPKDLTAKLQKQLLRQIWLTIQQETQERLAGIPAQQQG